ncbi:toll/interleukin-1 receptor domain-containing protein [Hydrogenophaga taeniospiralis]|uniref:toll/interleukin-1 receptor domain-containing protein n=1 Tax=Hydrogenophaga taeniospiralis TaxID=65656 RepID=UPI0039B0BAA8
MRQALCDPWIDDLELVSGEPWLDQIFSSGIPSCEVVLCYVTSNSIESKVFQQEMDARLLERLQNARVSLLIYTSQPDLRSKLRLDVQRLQIPVLNKENYSLTMPRLVAEIWRCYSENLVHSSVEAERVKRLEAELRVKELESNAVASVFTASENAEFSIIWQQMNRDCHLSVNLMPTRQGVPAESSEPGIGSGSDGGGYDFLLSMGAVFRACIMDLKFQPSSHWVRDKIDSDISVILGVKPENFRFVYELPVDFDGELLRYGLVQRQFVPSQPRSDRLVSFMHEEFKLIFTSKFDRFCFWVSHNVGAWDPLMWVLQKK